MDSELTELALQCIKRKETAPLLVIIRPTKRCVAKCQMCNLWKAKIQDMAFEKVKEIIEDATALGAREIRLTGGEPLLYNQFFETLHFIKEKNMDSSFITNGVILNKGAVKRVLEAKPKHMHVSIDFPTATPHNKQRGYAKAWENAFKGIKEIKKQRAGQRPKIVINFVASNQNYRLLPEFLKLGRGLFDEINLIPIRKMKKWFLSQSQAEEFEEKIWSEIEKKAKEANIKIRPGKLFFSSDYKNISEGKYNKGFYEKRKCFASRFMAFIETDGSVFSCANTPYDKSFSYGNIFSKRFKEIWQDKRLEEKPITKAEVCFACEPTSLLFNQLANESVNADGE